jgi:hypothetical protein
MASSANAITPPEGYTLEAAPTPQPKAAPAGITPPPGYALEAPTSPAPKGPTIGPQPNASQADVTLPESIAPAPLQKLTMPLVKGLIAAHDKLKEVESMTQEGQQAHPIQAHIGALANRIEGLLTGTSHGEAAIGTGQYGMLNNPVTGSLLPTGEGTPVLAEGLEAGANAVKEGYQAVKGGAQAAKDLVTGGEGPNIVRQAIKGKGVAQEPAQAAIREAAGAADDAALLEGNKTILDERLNNLKQQEAAAYKKLDDKAGFDVKEARIRLKNDQYKIKQLGNTDTDVAQREKLTAAIKDTSDRIAGAGVDTTEADNLHKSRKAGEEVKKLLVRSLGPDGKTINVDTFLNGAKNLRTISKYGDRFEQFFGKEATEGLINDLQEAQKAGKKALSVQKIAKWGLGGLGTVLTTGEAVKHVLP